MYIIVYNINIYIYIIYRYIYILYKHTYVCTRWFYSIYQLVVTMKAFAKDQLRCTSKYHRDTMGAEKQPVN